MRHLLVSPSPEPSAAIPHLSNADRALTVGFCVAAVYLFIFSLQNCFLNRNRTQNQANNESDGQDANRLSQLEAIPVIVYDSCSSPHSSGETCSICLGEYEEGEEVRVLVKCAHVFHKECIDRWLLMRSSSLCPICRDRVIVWAVEPPTANCGSGSGTGSNTNEEAPGVLFDVRAIRVQRL